MIGWVAKLARHIGRLGAKAHRTPRVGLWLPGASVCFDRQWNEGRFVSTASSSWHVPAQSAGRSSAEAAESELCRLELVDLNREGGSSSNFVCFDRHIWEQSRLIEKGLSLGAGWSSRDSAGCHRRVAQRLPALDLRDATGGSGGGDGCGRVRAAGACLP